MKSATHIASELPSVGEVDAPARGRSVTVWMAGDIARYVETLARDRKLASRNAAFVVALKAGLEALNHTGGRPGGPPQRAQTAADKEAMERLWFRSSLDEKRRIEEFKARHRYGDVSSAISDLITRALDAEDLGDNVPATKADELEQALRELRDLLDHIGPGVLGILGLLAHWATQSGGLEVDEEELIEEALAEGRRAWALRQEIAADSAHETLKLDENGGH